MQTIKEKCEKLGGKILGGSSNWACYENGNSQGNKLILSDN